AFAESRAQKISLRAHNTTLNEVMREIQKQQGYSFFFRGEDIAAVRINTVVTNADLSQAMAQILSDQDLHWYVEDGTIIITGESTRRPIGEARRKQPQQRQISGTVRDDESGEVLEGVTIAVKGTSVATVTDAAGNYRIAVPNDGSVLVFNILGYQSVEKPADGTSIVNVSLQSSMSDLDEVVVIGYGTARKSDLTGAITQLRPDEIADENPRTVQDILRGTTALTIGLDASAKNGGSINIRGQRFVYTAASHNSPLLILDGMIFYGELSEINPDDIEQIDILKDASAAAIYGAQSANGVIIITTKKGKQGKPKINFTSNIGLSTMGAHRPVWDPEGYLQYRQDWYTASTYDVNPVTGNYEPYMSSNTDALPAKGKPGYYEKPTPEMFSKYGITEADWRAYSVNGENASNDEIYTRRIGLDHNVWANYLAGTPFDWYDHSFREGFNQDYNVSVSGASDKINYYMSGGFLSNEGVIVGDNYQAIRSNLKVDGKVTDWLNIGANINFQDRSDGNIATNWSRAITLN